MRDTLLNNIFLSSGCTFTPRPIGSEAELEEVGPWMSAAILARVVTNISPDNAQSDKLSVENVFLSCWATCPRLIPNILQTRTIPTQSIGTR